MTAARLRLVLAAALLFGWLAVLGYSAASKDRGPVVSRSQMAVATQVVYAKLTADTDGKPNPTATVTETLTPNGPAVGESIEVGNLPTAAGFAGEGEYLLPLTRTAAGVYRIAGQPRSPGYEVPSDRLFIYPRGAGIEAQVKALLGAGK
jgi:hypothetical protein